jgi:hypothetical protein
MATFEDLERKLAGLSDRVFRISTSSAGPATEAELSALEAELGAPLPAEYRKLLSTWGALVVEVVESVWPRPQPLDVLPSWRFWYGFHVYGVGERVPRELSVLGARSPQLRELEALPLVKRASAKFLGVLTRSGQVGIWAPDGSPIELVRGGVIDMILAEIRELEEGVERLRVGEAGVEELMERGRAARWKGPRASDVVDALKQRPPADLTPHLVELADALLPPGTLSMGCLDIIAAAGKPAFGAVASRVYDHYGEGDDAYVIELLGKVEDTSPRAMELYREGLGSEDEDLFDYAMSAVRAIAKEPAARELVSVVEALLDADGEDGGDAEEEEDEEDDDDEDTGAERRARLVAALGHLESPAFSSRLIAVLGDVDDEAFSTLCNELKGLAVSAPPLRERMLERYRRVERSRPAAFNATLSLIDLGIEEREQMESIVRAFSSRGGRWAERAEPLLVRWGGAR